MGAVSGWARKMRVKEEREKGPHNGAFLPRPSGGALSHGPPRGPRRGGRGGRGGDGDGAEGGDDTGWQSPRTWPAGAGRVPPPPGAQLPPDGSPDGGAPGGSRWRRWGEAGRVPGAERRHLRPPPGSPSPGQAQLRPQTEPGGPRVAAR